MPAEALTIGDLIVRGFDLLLVVGGAAGIIYAIGWRLLHPSDYADDDLQAMRDRTPGDW